MKTPLFALLLCACAPGASDPVDSGAPILPGHNDCLPEGQVMDDATCTAVVEEDGRMPTTPSRAPGTTNQADDPRMDDPELAWLLTEVRRCTCVCCHTNHIGGPGSHRWDIEFEPVWIDSMSDWSISVFGGYTDEPNQTLPSTDPVRLRTLLQRELQARESPF